MTIMSYVFVLSFDVNLDICFCWKYCKTLLAEVLIQVFIEDVMLSDNLNRFSPFGGNCNIYFQIFVDSLLAVGLDILTTYVC
jgi:hypothetical protein